MPTQNARALLKIYTACAETLYPILKNLPDEQLNWQPAPDSRSIGELARHLIRVDKWFFDRLGFDHSISDPGETDAGKLLAALQNTHRQISDILNAMQDDADLIRKSGAADARPHDTLAEIVVHIAQHYLYHHAQMVYLRRARDRDWKAPLDSWENASYALSDALAVIQKLFSEES